MHLFHSKIYDPSFITVCNIQNWKLQFISWRDLTYLIFISLSCIDKSSKIWKEAHFLEKKIVFSFSKPPQKWLEKLYHKWQLENSSKAQWWWNLSQSCTLMIRYATEFSWDRLAMKYCNGYFKETFIQQSTT